jgi:hypothetical protein
MKTLSPLVRVELVALSALGVCALLFAGVMGLLFIPSDFYVSADTVLGPRSMLAISFFALGAPAVALYGAPAYSYLRKRDMANWPAVFALSIPPGLALAFFDKEWTLVAIGTGAIVGAITHAWFRRGF